MSLGTYVVSPCKHRTLATLEMICAIKQKTGCYASFSKQLFISFKRYVSQVTDTK